MVLVGCERGDKAHIEPVAVSRCERGIQRATAKNTMKDAMEIYYAECAGIHSEPLCRNAFKSAAKAPLDKQLSMIALGCSRAYCPILGEGAFEICRKDFQASGESLSRAWPPFHGAIVAREAGGMNQRVNNALLRLYVHTRSLASAEAEEPPTPAASPADAGKTDAAKTDAAPASSGAPPSASAKKPAAAASAAPASPK
jgi:hypothetical protein